MTRQVFEFDPPDRFVVGTVGMPGERTFFLQARAGSQVTSVVIEKQQARLLAERIEMLLSQVEQTGAQYADYPEAPIDSAPLDLPIVEEFRVGAMALGWDEGRERMVVEAHAQTDDDAEIPDIGDDDAPGAATLRVWLTARVARTFAARAQAVVAAGRPPCPFCSQPLDPAGHICPRANGYRRRE